ncbi:GGDEF domain-containing protein [Zobellella endophytica]|uniref:diguanylate cyclase n=1 Tax=Zobellella endophytica TaxID=2116700 RepID=A0A2P7R3H2_9GAMM|nr:biofilm regulation diguanylate cyclase SiaD [Zobellella endophytica]PSJ44781.1 GGDEF domain-containing protein [Zobellella endophytica]
MTEPGRPSAGEDPVAWLESLLCAPEHRDNPLLPALEVLLARDREQRARLERLLRISDCSHDVARSHTQELLQQYDKQLRRLEKITRISDRYQQNLLELNERLRQAALRDPLTGLANRRLLMARLQEEQERQRRTGEVFSLAMLDVDHFKRINDAFGHDAGDQVLCRMAGAIERQLRRYDLCARWGGEEFLILLPATPLAQARQMAERVMTAVREISLADIDEAIALTASIGLVQWRPDEGIDGTIQRADSALIQAKRNGRDRLQMAPS